MEPEAGRAQGCLSCAHKGMKIGPADKTGRRTIELAPDAWAEDPLPPLPRSLRGAGQNYMPGSDPAYLRPCVAASEQVAYLGDFAAGGRLDDQIRNGLDAFTDVTARRHVTDDVDARILATFALMGHAADLEAAVAGDFFRPLPGVAASVEWSEEGSNVGEVAEDDNGDWSDNPFLKEWRRSAEKARQQWQKVKDAFPVEWEHAREVKRKCFESAATELQHCTDKAIKKALKGALLGAAIGALAGALAAKSPVGATGAAIAGALALGLVTLLDELLECLENYAKELQRCRDAADEADDLLWKKWKAAYDQ